MDFSAVFRDDSSSSSEDVVPGTPPPPESLAALDEHIDSESQNDDFEEEVRPPHEVPMHFIPPGTEILEDTILSHYDTGPNNCYTQNEYTHDENHQASRQHMNENADQGPPISNILDNFESDDEGSLASSFKVDKSELEENSEDYSNETD